MSLKWGKTRILRAGWAGRKGKQYLQVMLRVDGRSVYRKVHYLVLEAFAGTRPEGMLALHRDDDTANNHISNLYWGTPGQNMLDRSRNGSDPNVQKTHCPQGHKYTVENTQIKRSRSGGVARSCRQCSRDYSARRRARNGS